jgi:hypothetical protein
LIHYQAVLCKYNESGFCKNGTDCPYAHGTSDKQTASIAKGALQVQNSSIKEEEEKTK